MPKQIRVNVQSTLRMNAADISSTTIEGVEHIIIKGAKHMIADTVMNGILYTSQDTFQLGEDLKANAAFIPAPAEHPMVNGGFVSASDPRSLIQHNVGAMHLNFRIEQNRLISDVAINPEVALRSDRGRELMKRIEMQQPVDMSTGFFLRRIEEPGTAMNGETFDAIASDLSLDHSALLLESPGAKTSDEGVGLFANAVNGDRIEVITSVLETNKTAPGSFPIAEGDPKWDGGAAVGRWREASDSTENPGDRYRQGFMWFDESRADKFDAYKLPFVDVIDGETVVVPAALRAIKQSLGGARDGIEGISESDRERIGARVGDLLEKAQQNNKGFITRVLNAVKLALNLESGYNQHELEKEGGKMIGNAEMKKGEEGKGTGAAARRMIKKLQEEMTLEEIGSKVDRSASTLTDILSGDISNPPDELIEKLRKLTPNHDGNKAMKDKILAALNAAGKPAEGLDDDALLAAYNSLQAEAGKDDGASMADAVAVLLKPMTEQITAINARLDAGPAKQKETDIESIVNSAKYAEFDKDALAAMPDAAIATMAANCQTSMSLNGHFAKVDKTAESTLPDGDE
jgi:hypothetical protein